MRRRVAAARRTFLVLRLSFSLLFRFKRDGCVVRTPRSFAPSSFVRHSWSFATLVRSPPSVAPSSFVRHPRSSEPPRVTRFGRAPRRRSRAPRRRISETERIPSRRPTPTKDPPSPRSASPRESPPAREVATIARTEQPPRSRLPLPRRSRRRIFVRRASPRDARPPIQTRSPTQRRDPRERWFLRATSRTAFPRRERPPPRTSSPREVPSIPSPPRRGEHPSGPAVSALASTAQPRPPIASLPFASANRPSSSIWVCRRVVVSFARASFLVHSNRAGWNGS